MFSSSDQKKLTALERLCGITYKQICPDCLNAGIRKASYIKKLKENVDTLKEEWQKLIEERDDVIWRVVLEEQQGKQRLSQVQGWVARVKAQETEVGELIEKSPQEIGKLSLRGYYSKEFRSSYKFGKKVVEKLDDLKKLKRDREAFKDHVADEKIPKGAAMDEKQTEPTAVAPQHGQEVEPPSHNDTDDQP